MTVLGHLDSATLPAVIAALIGAIGLGWASRSRRRGRRPAAPKPDPLPPAA